MSEIGIKRLSSHSDFEQVRQIQKIIWQHKDIDLTSSHEFYISIETGAILLGAVLTGKVIGFVYSFPAVFGKKLAQHSRQLAVLPDYRSLKIGKKLKWAQRRAAIQKGYDLITWTADPLIARNANLNFHALGAKAKTYRNNYYRSIPSLSLASGVPTDRLFIEWPIKRADVEKRRKKIYPHFDPDLYPKVVINRRENGFELPVSPRIVHENKHVLLKIPNNIHEHRGHSEWITKWQQSVRNGMRKYFRLGYEVVDFIYGDACFYVLNKG